MRQEMFFMDERMTEMKEHENNLEQDAPASSPSH